MSYTICYVSKASENLTEEFINEIFEKTVKKNNLKNINGILLEGLGNFFQVLEGDKTIIEDLYQNSILKDNRHSGVFEIIRRETEFNVFSDYSSNFNVVKTPSDLRRIQEYLSRTRYNSTSEKIKRLLTPFISAPAEL
ncbi:BLUF domain-containing protein [Jejudonia soesokkakensis]|uniref:BLUF domain-containing protein n=1 Tax=Jejudonia soesokkakensis TaxID=1323432 RepID=A0ABW2MTZ3_9FLAO